MKKHILFFVICVFVMFAVKFCMFLNYLATTEAKVSAKELQRKAEEPQ